MHEFMILKDSDGKEKKCEIIAVFQGPNGSYIAYTEEEDKKVTKDLLVSKYEKIGESVKLLPIDSEEEWKFVEDYLDKEIFDEVDQDE